MIERVQNLWQEARDLTLGPPPHIDRLPSPPTPLQFLRRYVAPNKPCLISAAVPHWPALSLWPSFAYLRETLASAAVSVHLTPTGKADALAPSPSPSPSAALCFASAHVEKLPFPEALDLVMASDLEQTNKTVVYLQQQNDCFRSTEALGCSPDAVNLWITTHGLSFKELYRSRREARQCRPAECRTSRRGIQADGVIGCLVVFFVLVTID